jgi:hypothetical protein
MTDTDPQFSGTFADRSLPGDAGESADRRDPVHLRAAPRARDSQAIAASMSNEAVPKLTPEERRAEYLRNQQAVAATPATRDGWLPLTIAGWVLGAAALALFVVIIIGYFNDPQQEGAPDTRVATIDFALVVLATWCGLLQWLLQARTVGGRIRNIIIAIVISAIVTSVGTGVIVYLGSLVAGFIAGLV